MFRFTLRHVALAGALAAGGLAAPLAAHAATGICRSDPIVVLTNGVVLDLSATIGDDATDVAQVSYTLHTPAGVAVASIVSTDGVVGYKETFAVRADSSTGVYRADTQVITFTPGDSYTGTLAGGYAATLGITPAMVGLTAFTSGGTTKLPSRPKKGGLALPVLPAIMTTYLNAWASTAPWSVTVSSPQGLSPQTVSASVTL